MQEYSLQFDKDHSSKDYHFVYDHNKPESLIILKDPKLITDLYNPSNFQKARSNFIYYNVHQQEMKTKILKVTHQTMLNYKQNINDQSSTIRAELFTYFNKLVACNVSQNERDYNPLAEQCLQSYMKGQYIKKKDKKKVSTTKDEAIIYLYTESFYFHQIFNVLHRSSIQPSELFYLQPFVQDIYEAIKNLYAQQKKKRREFKQGFECYRAAIFSNEEIQKLMKHKGKYIENLGVFSATTDFDIIGNFQCNTLITINVKDAQRYKTLENGFIYAQEYSASSHQKEILFNLLNSFKIKEVFISGDFVKFEIILSYGQSAQITDKILNLANPSKEALQEEELKVFFENVSQKQFALNSLQGVINIVGQVEIQFGKKYFQKLLELIYQCFDNTQQEKKLREHCSLIAKLFLRKLDQIQQKIKTNNSKKTSNFNIRLKEQQSQETLRQLKNRRYPPGTHYYRDFIFRFISQVAINFLQNNMKVCEQNFYQMCLQFQFKASLDTDQIPQKEWIVQISCGIALVKHLLGWIRYDEAMSQIIKIVSHIDFNVLFKKYYIMENIKRKEKMKVEDRQDRQQFKRQLQHRKKMFKNRGLWLIIKMVLGVARYIKNDTQKINFTKVYQNIQSNQDQPLIEKVSKQIGSKIIVVFLDFEQKTKKQVDYELHQAFSDLGKKFFKKGSSWNFLGLQSFRNLVTLYGQFKWIIFVKSLREGIFWSYQFIYSFMSHQVNFLSQILLRLLSIYWDGSDY